MTDTGNDVPDAESRELTPLRETPDTAATESAATKHPSPAKPAALPAYHPFRSLLDSAVRGWTSSLLGALLEDAQMGVHKPKSIANLRSTLLAHDLEALGHLFQVKKWPFVPYAAPSPPPAIVLTIEGVESPPAWRDGQIVRVPFRLQNTSNEATSGVIHGIVTQGIWREVVTSPWFQPGSRVADLPAGQELIGTYEMSRWRETRVPGYVDVQLTYWVQDEVTGTISIQYEAPFGIWHEITYGAASYAALRLGDAVSFAKDILPLFSQHDIEAMAEATDLDLRVYESVKSEATNILARIRSTDPRFHMPCDRPWSDDWIDTFRLWIEEGLDP